MSQQEETQRAFAALGEYVYEFSWLCQDMEMIITTLPGVTGTGAEVAQLLMGTMTADPLVGVCFAVMEKRAGHGTAAAGLVKALKNEVVAQIKRRNAFAHGHWMIGWKSSTGVELEDGSLGQETRDLPPTLTRVLPQLKGPEKRREEEIEVAALEGEVVSIRSVRHRLEEFNILLRGNRLYPANLPDVPLERIDLTDIYGLDDDKKLTRSGPKAATVPLWKHH